VENDKKHNPDFFKARPQDIVFGFFYFEFEKMVFAGAEKRVKFCPRA